jgi:hypothetical protein
MNYYNNLRHLRFVSRKQKPHDVVLLLDHYSTIRTFVIKCSTGTHLQQQQSSSYSNVVRQQVRQRWRLFYNSTSVGSCRSNSTSSSRNSRSGSSSTRPTTTVTGASTTGTVNGKKIIQIPAHTLTFTILFIPCALLAIYVISYGPSDEHVQDEVRQRYGNNRIIQQKNEALKDFFINAEQGIEDERLHQVLYGGRGEKKRLHAVDKELYGTEQGMIVKQQVTTELHKEMEEKKRRKKELRRQKRLDKQQKQSGMIDGIGNNNNNNENEKDNNKMSHILSTINDTLNNESVKTTMTYTILGTIAIAIGYIVGSGTGSGRRS